MDTAFLKEKVVLARQFLLEEGLIRRFGHISAFVPEEEFLWITPDLGTIPGPLASKDLLAIDLEGRMVQGKGVLPLEWIIHTAIHRARPDALSVIHTHPVFSTSLTIARRPLRPVYQHGAILGTEPVPVYDDPCVVTTGQQAATLAEVLGGARAVELRGHGSVIAGRSVEEAFAAAVFLEDNSKKQLYATLAGEVQFMSADEVQRASFSVGEHFLRTFWDYYCHGRPGKAAEKVD